MATQILEFRRTIHASPAELYRALTRPVAIREWLCDGATADARVGGHLHYWWNNGYYASGEFTALEPDSKVAVTWHGRNEPSPTTVAVLLQVVEGGTEVILAHAGVGQRGRWAAHRKEIAKGWEASLENLQSVVETGEDLRLTRRPMLGILVDEFTPEVATQLGVPVTEGTRLGGVIAGMGAEAAGLQKDDVVVSIGGKPACNFPQIAAALQGRRAGDVVKVEFYRGSEKRTVDMALSHRRMPTVPPTPHKLAETVEQVNIAAAAQLAACLKGVTEAEANHRPAAGEWNALEVVAHFILTERENQTWITDLINDDERVSDRFENTTNVPARIAALAGMYPASEMIIELLERSQAETVGMLDSLPPEFAKRKGSYWRLGHRLLEQGQGHAEQHVEQMRAAIAAARSQ